MGRCVVCGTTSATIARELAVCLGCIRTQPAAALAPAMDAHRRSRVASGLPPEPPQDPRGIPCKVCTHECRIPEHGVGYCGLRRNEGGRLIGVSATRGKLSWYHDPLPTNCVGDWVCPGGTGAGHPQYAYCCGPEFGYTNLAVFFEACSFDCLFCQNWQFRQRSRAPRTRGIEALVADVDPRTACICYFGGDPAVQLPFSLTASKLARERAAGRILRICWETNGSMHARLLDQTMELALASGGCVKFDLKAWDDTLHRALTGVSNHRTLDNFARAAERIPRRREPPLLIASTLLVTGYVDEVEVCSLARFLAAIDPEVPYSLLAFAPHFCLDDLPPTPGRWAARCIAAAQDAGLRRVRLGNVHLLSS